jgi:FtsP/CotA-like multicopper oxidase with cupredoxin domain
VIAVDGQTLRPSARYFADTVNVGPGQRFDVIWKARQPGKWTAWLRVRAGARSRGDEPPAVEMRAPFM